MVEVLTLSMGAATYNGIPVEVSQCLTGRLQNIS